MINLSLSFHSLERNPLLPISVSLLLQQSRYLMTHDDPHPKSEPLTLLFSLFMYIYDMPVLCLCYVGLWS